MRRLGQSECINFFSLEKAVNFLFFNLNSKKSKLRSICLITHNAARMIKLWFNTAILYLADCLQLSYLMCGNPCVQNKNIVLQLLFSKGDSGLVGIVCEQQNLGNFYFVIILPKSNQFLFCHYLTNNHSYRISIIDGTFCKSTFNMKEISQLIQIYVDLITVTLGRYPISISNLLAKITPRIPAGSFYVLETYCCLVTKILSNILVKHVISLSLHNP